MFKRVSPRLAVFSHLAPAAFDPTARTRAAGYTGPLQVGSDLSSITIGDTVSFVACDSIQTPIIEAITDSNYGKTFAANAILIVWGSGFSAKGGNIVQFRKAAAGNGPPGSPIVVDEAAKSYFWDLSTAQINVSVAGVLTPGQWTVTVRNACELGFNAFPITVN